MQTGLREALLADMVDALRTRFGRVQVGYPVTPPSAPLTEPQIYVWLRGWSQRWETAMEVQADFALSVAVLVNGTEELEQQKLRALDMAEGALMDWVATDFPADHNAQLWLDTVDPTAMALNPTGLAELPVLLPPWGAVRLDCRVDMHYSAA